MHPAQIRAIKFDQVEGAQHRSAAVLLPADQIEHGKAVVASDDGLTIDQERVGRQRLTGSLR
jgi:hypothetical protein